MDDGQIFCDARHVDEVLRTLDEVAAEAGAVRGRGDDAKSVVRILGQRGAVQEVDAEWCTDYVAASTKPIPVSGGHVLGIDPVQRDVARRTMQNHESERGLGTMEN